MTTPISDHDWEAISAYLDGELNPKERARLDARLQASAELRAALEDMRRTRTVLRSQPRLRAPRNFTLSAQAYSQIQQRRPGLRLSPVFAMVSAFASFLFVVVVAGELLTAGPSMQTMPLAAEAVQEAAPMEMEAPAEDASQADQSGAVVPEAQPVPTEGMMLAQEGEELSSKAAQPPQALVGAAEAYPPPTLAASSAALVYPPPAEQVQDAVEAPLPEATQALEGAEAARSAAGASAEPTPTEDLAQALEPQLALQEAPAQVEAASEIPTQPTGGFFSGWRFLQIILILLALASGIIAILLRRSGA